MSDEMKSARTLCSFETNRLRSQARIAIQRGHAEIRKIDRELEMLVELIRQGGAASQINKKMGALEKRKKDLEAKLGEAKSPPPRPLKPYGA